MSLGITLTQAQASYQKWFAIDVKMSEEGIQKYNISGSNSSRQVEYVTAKEVSAKLDYWESLCNKLARGGKIRQSRMYAAN